MSAFRSRAAPTPKRPPQQRKPSLSESGVGRLLFQTIEAFAAIVEARDPYTAGHQKATSALSILIADELGLDDRRKEGLRVAGLCHDIGKAMIPMQVLSKPARLSKAEMALVQEHVELGYNVLRRVNFPWPVAEIVRQHHERLDGSGYPRGLKGDEILLEARILGAADTIDAMVSHRPYRSGHAPTIALAEIRAGRGTGYDPAVVDVLFSLRRSGALARWRRWRFKF